MLNGHTNIEHILRLRIQSGSEICANIKITIRFAFGINIPNVNTGPVAEDTVLKAQFICIHPARNKTILHTKRQNIQCLFVQTNMICRIDTRQIIGQSSDTCFVLNQIDTNANPVLFPKTFYR